MVWLCRSKSLCLIGHYHGSPRASYIFILLSLPMHQVMGTVISASPKRCAAYRAACNSGKGVYSRIPKDIGAPRIPLSKTAVLQQITYTLPLSDHSAQDVMGRSVQWGGAGCTGIRWKDPEGFRRPMAKPSELENRSTLRGTAAFSGVVPEGSRP